MTWPAYRAPGDINGVPRGERIGLAVLSGDLDVVRAVVALARRFVSPEVHLTHDEIDTLFAAIRPLSKCVDVVIGTEHELSMAARSTLSSQPANTVLLWKVVSELPAGRVEMLAIAAGSANE